MPITESDGRFVRAFLQFIDNCAGADSAGLSAAQIESLSVARECLESAFAAEIASPRGSVNVDLRLIRECLSTNNRLPEAEAIKERGNQAMKDSKFEEAAELYTQAIRLSPSVAAFYCNRAAARFSLNQFPECIDDCKKAISLNPQYSKAYGRMGMAYMSMGKRNEAQWSLQEALRFDPNNQNAKTNLDLLMQTPSTPQTPPQGSGVFSGLASNSGVDLGHLLSNPSLTNMASQFVSNPTVQQMLQNMLQTLSSGGGGAQPTTNNVPNDGSTQNQQQGLGDLMAAGQRLASQLAQSNPEIIEMIRNATAGRQNPPPQDDQNPGQQQ